MKSCEKARREKLKGRPHCLLIQGQGFCHVVMGILIFQMRLAVCVSVWGRKEEAFGVKYAEPLKAHLRKVNPRISSGKSLFHLSRKSFVELSVKDSQQMVRGRKS